MKLISMTEKVLKIEQYLDLTNKQKLELIFNYANFLKQPLELWMFVPCDENGNVLEDPCKHNQYCADMCQGRCQEYYNEAKERVLFDGFFIAENQDTKPTDVKSITNGLVHIFWYNKQLGWYNSRGLTSIEDLVKYNIPLTPNAIKQLNL